MKYKFQNIIGHLSNGCDMTYGYVLVLDNSLSIMNYMVKDLGNDVEAAFLNHIAVSSGKSHYTNDMAYVATIRAQHEGISYVEALSRLSSDKIDGMIKTQKKYGVIYLQKVGSYFYCKNVTVLDEIITDKFIYPTKKILTTKDINITRWPNGKHYYVTIDGNQLEVDGVCKWVDVEYAKELAETEIKKLNLLNKN